jgi:hypothetical protein
MIFAHKSPDQLARLIHRLNTSKSIFFVHVDKGTDDLTFNEMVEGVRELHNITFVKRNKVEWGWIIFAINEVISDIVHRKIEFDYIFFLSGQDYPIKTNAYIEDFLAKNKGKQFINYFLIPRDPSDGWANDNGGLDRIENWHIRLFKKCYRIPGRIKRNSRIKSIFWHFVLRFIPKRKFIQGYKPFGGEAWWCLTKECTEYMNAFMIANPRFVSYFKYVDIADEIFYQSIILNSAFKDSVINDDLRCIDWSAGGSHPRIWRKGDIEILRRSKGLIARKFDSRVDSEVLDLIDSKLLQTGQSEAPEGT